MNKANLSQRRRGLWPNSASTASFLSQRPLGGVCCRVFQPVGGASTIGFYLSYMDINMSINY